MLARFVDVRFGLLPLMFGLILLPFIGGCGLMSGGDGDPGPGPDAAGDQGWAVEVVQVSYGTGATFGQQDMPGIVLGASKGAGTGQQSLDVVSLGVGGSIVLRFGPDSCVLDGEGDDLAVLENPFFVTGDANNRFIEAATVEVSQDGKKFFAFPSSMDDGLTLGDPRRYAGFAGVAPVLAGDVPDEVGGDRFDLADLGLTWVRFVRITDVSGTAWDPLDPGDVMGIGSGMDGFDLDAVGAIHLGNGEECE